MLKLRMRSTGKSAREGVLASLPGTFACEVWAVVQTFDEPKEKGRRGGGKRRREAKTNSHEWFGSPKGGVRGGVGNCERKGRIIPVCDLPNYENTAEVFRAPVAWPAQSLFLYVAVQHRAS